ncbi:MAG: hypothetical protein Q9222_002017 [Ikaeria aurantiellina]
MTSLKSYPANVHVSQHPCLRAKLSQLRSKDANARETKTLIHEIAMIVACEALATELKTVSTGTAETPLGYTYTTETVHPPVALVPILRSGLGMLDGKTKPTTHTPSPSSHPLNSSTTTQLSKPSSPPPSPSTTLVSSANPQPFSRWNTTTTSPTTALPPIAATPPRTSPSSSTLSSLLAVPRSRLSKRCWNGASRKSL